LGDEAIEHIIKKCDIPLVFATADKAAILLKIAAKLPTLKTIIVMDEIKKDLSDAALKTKVKLVLLTTLEKEGSQNPVPSTPIATDDIATISFTSGTTGMPKGVMLTHGNMLAFLTGVLHLIEHNQVYHLSGSDVHISYLPLAHVLERSIQVAIFYLGASIGFYQGDTLKLMDDMAILQPTIFVSVPRLYNRIYDRILGSVKAAGGIKAALFNYAYESKKYWLRHGYVKHSVWDRLVFGAVRARLGGKVGFMMTGAAPISPDVLDFLRICFSVKLVEGYGQTEGNGGTCATHTTDLEPGHVGPPMPHSMCKLRDVPSMNYFSTDQPHPRGEICFKGASIFKGYFKEPEKTKETLSDDGWCYTGDVGYWDSKGRLRIIDRVKK
jgi:long-chain acyl-CoA synthetase